MNRADLIGRLVRDPDVRYTQGNNSMAVAKFTLAVDRKIKRDNEQNADFINCVAFGKAGEFVEKYFHKGMKVAVSGRIQTGSYTNKEGQKVYTTDIVVEEQEFCESKNNNGGNESMGRPEPEKSEFMNIPEGIDEDLPFNQPNTARPVQQTLDDLPFARSST